MLKCLVIGNGPSLAKVPNEFLDRYMTFGSNRIYLKYEPSFYCAVNPLVIKKFHKEISKLLSIKFIPKMYASLIENVAYKLNISKEWKFHTNALLGVHEGWTVTFVLLQLAYMLGFRDVGLVGVDHSYQYEGKPNEKLRAVGPDPNHFHPDYFRNVDWNAPDLKRSEASYLMAKRAFDLVGGRIVNLTEGSKLEVFEKEDLGLWI